eukprot:4900310-Prymnesium_polylepis.2
MEALLKKEHERVTGICSTRMLVLSLRSPSVPTIDLIDLPGLVQVPGPEDPADLPMQTEDLIKKFIGDNRENAIFLALCPAGGLCPVPFSPARTPLSLVTRCR